MQSVTKQMARKSTKKGDQRAAKLWNDLQNDPAKESAIPALVATREGTPDNQWLHLLACSLSNWEANRKGELELIGPKEWTPARRLQLADDLLWTLRFFKGQVWLQGDQLCVQPVDLAQHYAPVIRALKTELILLLKENLYGS